MYIYKFIEYDDSCCILSPDEIYNKIDKFRKHIDLDQTNLRGKTGNV